MSHAKTKLKRKPKSKAALVPANCSAAIWHGPGHQSQTKCQLIGKHKIHMAIYGSAEQIARWKGRRVFSGFFDEPPNKEKP